VEKGPNNSGALVIRAHGFKRNRPLPLPSSHRPLLPAEKCVHSLFATNKQNREPSPIERSALLTHHFSGGPLKRRTILARRRLQVSELRQRRPLPEEETALPPPLSSATVSVLGARHPREYRSSRSFLRRKDLRRGPIGLRGRTPKPVPGSEHLAKTLLDAGPDFYLGN